MKITIKKWGECHGVKLPKHLLERADISEKDIMEVIAEENRILSKKAVKNVPKTMRKRFSGFSEPYDAEIIDWDSPAGREIW
ncbi:MAG: hypothetical protein LIP23_00885 [Planctomycetes bacterium]|nr:hypothetical protein [Planctomycetota bacterium]